MESRTFKLGPVRDSQQNEIARLLGKCNKSTPKKSDVCAKKTFVETIFNELFLNR